MNKLIIGLVGQLAAGKGTVTKYLKEKHQAVAFRFSDPLREALDLFDLSVSRDNLQLLSQVLRQHFGENLLARAVAKKAKETTDQLVVIDGVRRLTDVENLLALPEFVLLAVVADQKIRYQRNLARQENSDDDLTSFEEFCKKDVAESESQIPEVIKRSRFTVDNNGDLENLLKQIEEVLNQLK